MLFAHGVVEGDLPFHSGAWHIYLGEKPENRRIVADVLKKLFRADAYVMIDGTKTELVAESATRSTRSSGRSRSRCARV